MNIEFLKKLKQKLQIGNTRSIHLNAYPGRLAARLDLHELTNIKQNLPTDFLNKLLNNPSFEFKFQIASKEISLEDATPENNNEDIGPAPEHRSITPVTESKQKDSIESELKKNVITKRLSSIYYENEDTYLEHGVKTFGFGYPTLLYRSKNDPDKIINAPVFIWKLELLRDKNEWIISRDEDMGITINDVLLNYLEQDLGTTGFVKLNEEYLSDSLIDEVEFEKIIEILLSQISESALNMPGDRVFSPMMDKQSREQLVKSAGNPLIKYSGIFGLFKTPKEPLIHDISTLIENIQNLGFDNIDKKSYQKIKYSAVETDPTQEHALKSLGENNKLIIHGPPGTGKSQTLTAIIVNALFNNAKCLVVCEKRTALEVIQKNLDQLGLLSLCGLIEDVNRDRKKIIDVVRDPKPELKTVKKSILDSLFQETDENVSVINSNHLFYSKFLLNDMTWSDLVGKFLNLKNKSDVYLKLYNEINSSGIDISKADISEEINQRLNAIKKSRKLFKTAKNDLDTFKILIDSLYEYSTPKDIVLNVCSQLSSIDVSLEKVISDLNNLNEEYSKSLTLHFQKYYDDLHSLINKINGIYQKNVQINKLLFTKISSWNNIKLGLLALFSGKYKQFKKDKNDIVPLYTSINNFLKAGYFNSHTESIIDDISIIEYSLDSISKSLKEWHDNIIVYLTDQLNNYSFIEYNVNAFPDINSFRNAEDNSVNIINELNSSGLFSINFEYPGNSVKNKISYLTDVNQNVKLLIKDIDYLYDYFHWRSDYLANDIINRRIIDSLIKNGSDDWGFDSELWFIFNILLHAERNISLRDDSIFETISANLGKIKDYQLSIILENWRSRQRISSAKFLERTGVNINALYNKSRNNKFNKRNSLRKIISADFELFTDFFPVMLVNPVVCSSVFEMKEGLFDIVIFDEASQLRVEDIYAAKLRGSCKVVSGDENQMPPSNYFASSAILIDNESMNEDETEVLKTVSAKGLADSESLLEFAIRRGYEEAYLDIHYRSKHPDLIDFSNAAFYNYRLNPMPPENNYKAMRYFQVSGIYDQAEGINKQEAVKVISLIDELINPEKVESNPSIGIATFNIFQRNYILDMLNQKAISDSLFAQKMSILKNKPSEPFFVKNLENIQGDERDIIIISTTFGKRPDGSFLQNFGPINQEKGYRLLNVIVTRAKYMMIVCTSIPQEYIQEFPSLLAANGNKGKGIFYSYLAYAKSIEEYDLKSRNAILELLKSNAEEKAEINLSNNVSVFEDEIYSILKEQIPAERLVRNYQTGGFTVDIAVISSDKYGKVTAIECDGTNMHTSPEAYAWDMFREKYLEKFGIKFIRVWSVNWWNNPERELQRLLEFINKF